MPNHTHGRHRAGRTIAVLAGFLALTAIAFLTLRVSHEIKEQSSAQSDNAQFSLSQTEVEFQELRNHLLAGDSAADIRRRFDIFYSRINTVRNARVFADLRTYEDFANLLDEIEAFLQNAAPLIDVDDAQLIANVPQIATLVEDLRLAVRGLSLAGLNWFATQADAKREAVARTMIQLAAALAVLISVLGLGVVYLVRLNGKIIQRERQQVQTAMRSATIMNTSLDGVIVSDAQGHITAFNAAAEKIFGHNADDVLGKSIGDVIVPDHLLDAHNAGMARIQAGGEKHVVGKGRVQLEARRGDGSTFPVELAVQSAVMDEGDIYIAFLRDVSQRVADEQELIRARDKAIAGEQARSDFLATMSHEIRTPLNGLLGNMSLLRDTSLSTQQDTYLRHMETSGRLLMSHVSDVLDIARYDSGRILVQSAPLNISALLQDIIDNQCGMAASQNTTLDWGWKGTAQQWISGDADRIQHILMNLIGNAVKFTEQGRVSVTLSWADGELSVMIEDTGVGIAPDLLDHVFDDFVTGDTSYDRAASGTGLGLGIVRRFVEALEGEVSVESTLGKGSTFMVTFPAAAAEMQDEQDADEAFALPSAPQRVLIVEDNEINRFVVRNMLIADGHSVAEAFDGKQGVEMASAEPFDLILMDISMPVMDGRTATTKIREGNGASATSRIVALTANVLPEEQADFLANGMDGVLTKPLTRAALQTVLRNADRPAADTHDDDLVDVSLLSQTRDTVGAEAFAPLLAKFDTEVAAFAESFTEDADPADIAAAAHKVAGSATLFGASQLRQVLVSLEQAVKAGTPARIWQMRGDVLSMCQRTRAALRQAADRP